MPGNPRVAVVGGGVLGLMCAWRLAQAGARMELYDAAPGEPNASSVAAGMIAPAAECALEPPLRALAGPLLASRAAWTQIAADLGLSLGREGTRLCGDPNAVARRAAALAQAGFVVGAIEDDGARGASVLAPQDAVIASAAALAALRVAVSSAGGTLHTGRVVRDGDGLRIDDALLEADVVVLATGAPGRGSRLAPELDWLSPIKGQLLRWRGVAAPAGPAVRLGEDTYVTAHDGEVTAGATMEAGRDDLQPEPAFLQARREAAERLFPQLRGLAPAVQVGVRADTPDGLPLVGPSATPGVVLATGARRNGWLWAPPVADIITAQVLGRPLGALAPLAERLHPGRFSSGEAT